jgi:hypothetical protein
MKNPTPTLFILERNFANVSVLLRRACNKTLNFMEIAGFGRNGRGTAGAIAI